MSGEKNMETYIIICKIDSQQEIAVWLRKLKKKKGLCTNLEGWVGEVDGREVLKGRIYVYLFCKAIILQLKNK